MADMLEIVAATTAELDAIEQIENASFPKPWCRAFFAEELRLPGRLSLVARHDGVLAGYLFAMWIFEEMHVNKIAVAQQMRRQGIAERLMAKALSFAREHGIERISLEVRASNETAQAFYAHLGFTTTYVRKRYYPDGESALVMTLELDASSRRPDDSTTRQLDD